MVGVFAVTTGHSRAPVALLALSCLSIAIKCVAAHGWIAEPPSRNLIAEGEQGFYQQMALNRPGAAVTGGVCGGVFPGDARFSVGGQFAGCTIAANWTEGSVVEIVIQIYTNHWGRFEMRLCPLSHAGDAAEAAELSEECLSQHVLTLADGSGPYHFVKGGNDAEFLVDQKWKLPAGVSCERCVLQWRYVTGHQCLPPGVDVDYVKQNYMSWPTYCGPDYLSYDVYTNPEKFWNCADVTITPTVGAAIKVPRKALPDSVTAKLAAASGTGSDCNDITPPQGFSCSVQKLWGKCSASWMAAGGFCKRTCGGCGVTPTAQRQLISSGPTPAPATPDAMVTMRFGQCGGGFGGSRCAALPSGKPRCANAAWPWVTCPTGTACQRINSSYWQCRDS